MVYQNKFLNKKETAFAVFKYTEILHKGKRIHFAPKQLSTCFFKGANKILWLTSTSIFLL
uniref:hypothetical protein n=1 Tax=Chitinophaga sp. 212800008-4 TaxID=3108349 RepID=UPI00403F6A60